VLDTTHTEINLKENNMFSANTKEAANATVSDAKATAYSAKRDFNNTSEDAGDEFARAASKAGRRVRGFIDSANEHISEASDKVTGEIRSNPVRSSAIALGVGFVLGALLRR
jgi:ElaB/YqjD/DUF883 family membrane-anchored ribosome-binding protein